jgi:predicted DNA-binding transcriptional regulator YafY
MPRVANQKEKLLVLLSVLQEKTDEDHPLSVPQLLAELQERGILAERKSIYDDLETLRRQGYDVVLRRGKGYYLGEREFQLAELKLLVDAVQSSRFITARKSNELIEKLERQTSVYGAQALQRQVFVAGRVKSMNESVYYNIDAIHQAIGENRQITFQYFDYDRKLRRVFRHGGALYRVSPYALLRSDENYYLTAYDSRAGRIRHYRVDKMTGINVTKRRRLGEEAYQSFDLADYARIHFNMFKGEEREIMLRCDNRFSHVIIDRFGEAVHITPEDDSHFTAQMRVAVSPQFYGWLFGLGPGVTILGPAEVAQGMKDQLELVLRNYTVIM